MVLRQNPLFHVLFNIIQGRVRTQQVGKVANMMIIFPYSIILSYNLFNHQDPKQYELGYLTIFIISTLLVLNVVLTLNPIYKDQGTDSYSRSCCSS